MRTWESYRHLSRRQFLGQTTAAVAGLAQNRNRPANLIYVFADQLRRFSCGYAGDEYARTPNIDRLARESLDVRNAAASTPVCAQRAVEGADLSGNLLGRSVRGPETVYMQGMGTTAAWQDGTEWRAMRDARYTYAIYRRDRSELLFDNVVDPYQLKNLAGERAHYAKLTHYRAGLQQWMKEHNDQFESCTWYRDHWTNDRNIIDTASGVKQDLAALEGIVQRTSQEMADPSQSKK